MPLAWRTCNFEQPPSAFDATREKATPVSRRSKFNGQGQRSGQGQRGSIARLNQNNQLNKNQLNHLFQPR
jgi:hypothetical protein